MGRSRTWIRKILVALAAFVAIAVAAEILLRILSPEHGNEESPAMARIKQQMDAHHTRYVPDPDLGALLEPSRTTMVETPDFIYSLQTDHAGFPNLEPWPTQIDVAVLGNSLITGSGVGNEGQFTTLLGHELGGRSVLNFGIHGGGTGHQLRAFRKFAAPLKPKLVVSTLWLVWEIDNSLKFEDWLADNTRPDFTNYRLTYGKSSPTVTLKNLFWHLAGSSRLLRAAASWLRSYRGVREPDESIVLASGDVMLLSNRNAARLMQGWERPSPRNVRDVFYTPLESLKQEVEAKGGTFLVVLIPSKEELYAAKDFPNLLMVVNEARTELAARGIATLDLYPELEQQGTPPPFFSVDMHLNASGHRLVAHAIARWADERKIFPRNEDGLLDAVR